jgi:spore coat protein U-like protein
MRLLKYALLLGGSLLPVTPAISATALGNLTVHITITNECKVQTGNDLNFGSHGVLDANLDVDSSIGVQCTTGQAYTVALGVGNGAGATTAIRSMTGPGGVVNYSLYRDTTRLLLWGETAPTNTVAGTGNGSVQNLPVYGRVPPQTTPSAGVYADTVIITVSY